MPEELAIFAAPAIINQAITFESNIPTKVSFLKSASSLFVASAPEMEFLLSSSSFSSTSSFACQKKRYGEIVVPKMAAIIRMESLVHAISGMSVLLRAESQSIFK